METSTDPTDTLDAAGKLRLKVVEGNAAGTVIEVEDELVIGRQAEGAGTLANDIEISRRHARIMGRGDGAFIIEDLGSTNGTFVDGRPVEAPTVLETGDRIEVGATALVVQLSAAALSPTPTKTETVAPALGEPDADDEVVPAAPIERDEASARPVLTLRIDLDWEAGTASVALDDDGDEVKLAYEDGRWRLE